MKKYFCTSYCNFGHSKATGKPLDHECYVLPPRAIFMEYAGEYMAAQDLILATKPLRTHPGTRCRHTWESTRKYSLNGYVLSTECSGCGKLKQP